MGRNPLPYWHLWGSLGPLLAAFLVSGAAAGRAAAADLAKRMVRWRAGPGWFLMGLLGPVVLFVLAAPLVRVVDGVWPDIGRFGESTEYPRLPLLAYWVASVVCYGYGEEVGWRGLVLPRLQDRYGALLASSVLSVFWALWHVPLFAFADGLQKLGIAGAVGWYFSLWIGSILLTWLLDGSGGSILVVALFHGVLDIAINSPGEGSIQIPTATLRSRAREVCSKFSVRPPGCHLQR